MPLLLDGEQRTEEWFAARRGRVTASLAAACLGLDPYLAPRGAWTQITTGKQKKANNYTRWGIANEGNAREAYEEATGNMAWETGFWVHDDHPWLGASPDGLIPPDGLLEKKCPHSIRDKAGVIRPASETQRLQMLVQLAVTGRAWVDFFAWTPTEYHLERVVRPAASVLDNLIARLQEFYDTYVRPNVQPPRRKRKC